MRIYQVARRAAFTLVEILLVVLVMAIAAVIVIPRIGSAQDSQVISAARVVQSDLDVVRSLAVTTQKPYTLLFSPDKKSYKVAVNYAATSYAATTPVPHPIYAKQNYEVFLASLNGMNAVLVTDVNSSGTQYVTFQPLGDPAAAWSVTLQSGRCKKQVSVEALTGNIAVTTVP